MMIQHRNPAELIARIKSHHPMLKAEDAVGVVASYGKAVSVEGDGRTIVVIATTDDIDLQQEVVVPSGADKSYFELNGKVFADHCYMIPDIIGYYRSASPFMRADTGQAGWKVRIQMRNTPTANDILEIAQEDGLGWSIGFKATDYGKPTADETKVYAPNREALSCVVRKWQWLELSATGFPCNVSCQGLGSLDMDKAKGVFDNLLCQNRIKRHTAMALGFAEAESKIVQVGIDLRPKTVIVV